MKYHVILPAFDDAWISRLKSTNGLIEDCLQGMEGGVTYVFAERKAALDLSQVKRLAPTPLVRTIYVRQAEAESALKLLAEAAEKDDLLLFAPGFMGKELAVRLAARAGGSSLTDACSLTADGETLTVVKPIYASRARGTFRMTAKPFCVALGNGLPESKRTYGIAAVSEEQLDYAPDYLVARSEEKEEGTSGLASAKFAVVGGRGMGSKETADKIAESAKKLGAEFGVSRPAAMNAWAPMNRLVGVSGAMIHPEVCVAAGVSGAAALYEGIRRSEFIISVNEDENAPINRKSDVAVIGDAEEILTALADIAEGKSHGK